MSNPYEDEMIEVLTNITSGAYSPEELIDLLERATHYAVLSEKQRCIQIIRNNIATLAQGEVEGTPTHNTILERALKMIHDIEESV